MPHVSVMKTGASVLLAFACWSAHADAGTCAHAQSATEKRVCADPALVALDSRLAVLLQAVQSETRGHDGETGETIDPLGRSQLAWLRDVRDACADRGCLESAYARRLQDIRAQWTELVPEPPASSARYRYERHADFTVFIEDFRRAVAADDRLAVVKMVARPFADFSTTSEPYGPSCLEPQDACTPQKIDGKLTSRDQKELLAKYDRIFNSQVQEALRKDRVRAFDKAVDESRDESGELMSQGPIVAGEFFLENDDPTAQRIFVRSPADGRYRLARVPFYE